MKRLLILVQSSKVGQELDAAEKGTSASYVREMMKLTAQSTDFLRKALAAVDPDARVILTEWGVGYRMAEDV